MQTDMEISMKADCLPVSKEEEPRAALEDLSSMLPGSQFASTIVPPQDSSLPNFGTSPEDISVTQEAILQQENPATEEPMIRSCITPENITAEATDVASNPVVDSRHIDEIESLDVQPFNAQETITHDELLGWHGLPLGEEQIPSTLNSMAPSSSTESMIQNSLPISGEGELCGIVSEERPQDINDMDWNVSDGLVPLYESIAAGEGSALDIDVLRTEAGNGFTNVMDATLSTNEGAIPDMGTEEPYKQVNPADIAAVIGSPAFQREAEPSGSICGTDFHECVAVTSSEKIVTSEGSKAVVFIKTEAAERLGEPSNTCLSDVGDHEIPKSISGAEREMKQAGAAFIPHDPFLDDSNDTMKTVSKQEGDEGEMIVCVTVQHLKDDVNVTSQKVGVDTATDVVENNHYSIGVDKLQEIDIEGKPAMAVGNGLGEMQISELKTETEGEKDFATGASEKLKVEEETDHVNTQSQEMDMDVQDPEMPFQNSEGELGTEQPEHVPIDSEMLTAADDVSSEQQMLLAADDVSSEQQQPLPRKRGRKPGKKVIKKAEKDVSAGLLQEFEPEKETGYSPLKHPVENVQKRELRKRGRKAGTTKVSQKEEEDVCFVCFDGGKLILCDKRSCPKAYHVECTGRESEFFEKRGQWFCGWHVCSQCSRSAKLNCYLCPSALCSTCMKGSNFLCIRKSRGLCEGCYPLVHMIEHNETINGDPVQVDFNDKETYEGLFKEYWEELKLKVSLTSMELEKACKAKEIGGMPVDDGTNHDAEENMGEEDGASTDSEDRPPTTRQVRLMKRKRLTRHSVVEDTSESEFEDDGSDDESKPESTPKKGQMKAPEFDGWVSKELADVIKSLKEDPKKQLPIFGVKKLLWRYIDENKLSNPRQKGQILCDERLQKLFGKKHVGRFEMMKLISLHVASPNKLTLSKIRELQHGDTDAVEPDDSDENHLGKKKSRRKIDDNKRMKPHPSDYAAVNVKNINLIYLKRSVLDELRNDPELENKAMGAFVRIRVPGSGNKNDACYRLVQVVGVKQIYDAHDPEKVTDVILEILNLHKREEVTADLVSNQDLVEEECLRLRQSVRCGFIKALRVGELEERARALREAKVKDWREYELLRLSHLRDRASEKGRKKELRECVEKLQLLNTPEEKERLLKAPFDIDADPHMDPDYESDEDEVPADDGQGKFTASQSLRETGFSTRYSDRGNNAGGSVEKHYNHRDSGNIPELPKMSQDTQLKSFFWGPKDFGHEDPVKQTVELQSQGSMSSPRTPIDRSVLSGQGKFNRGDGAGIREQTSVGWNQGSFGRKEVRWTGGNVQSYSGWRKNESADEVAKFPLHQGEVSAELALGSAVPPIHMPATPGALASAPTVSITNMAVMVADSEKEKVWCYQDPTRTVQGPFTMEQLRKWEKTNLFPLDLRIWRVTESQDASILLSDALVGRFNSRESLGPSQKSNLPLGPMQGTYVNGFPVPSAQVPTGGPMGGNLSSGSAQGILANSAVTLQRPNVQSFPVSPMQGHNAHALPPGPLQGPTQHGVQTPSAHGFPPAPTQGSNVRMFAPVPSPGAYVNNFTAAPTQGATFNALPPGSMQGPNVTGYPPNLMQGLNAPGQTHMPVLPGQPQAPIAFPIQMQAAPNVLPGQAQQAPNVLAGNMGSHFGNAPMGHGQGPRVNNFPMGSTPGPVNNNPPQMGHAITHAGRDFRNAAMPNRPANEWQEMGRRSGPDQHFAGPVSKAMDGSSAGGMGVPTRSAWRAQGRGAPRHDSREAHNRGHFGHGQGSRGSDYHQGSEGRFVPKKDLFCKYFSKGLCRRGEACDFRHH